MESRTTAEPGSLKTFRLFTGVRLALLVFALLVYLLASGWAALSHWPFFVALLLDAALLLAYLSLARVGRWLQGLHLPLGIVWATIGPMAQLYLMFFLFASMPPERSAFLLVLQPILVLFIPLVIVAWRYAMHAVILFCGLTFLIDVLLVVLTYARLGVALFSPILGMAFIRTVLFLFVGNMVANLVKAQREQTLRLAIANERLAHYAATLEQLTISRERNRMARELHDVLAHTMSGVAVELEGVRAMLRVDPDQAEALLGHSLRAVREGLTETRRALQALRAAPLEDLGLGLAVQYLVDSIAGRAGLQTELRIEKDLRDYPVEVQQCYYRVAQESLTNVVAHAQARKVEVCLTCDGPALKLRIRDDGIGFDENQTDLSHKYGLLGMRERVEMIDAELSIVSKVGAGTEIYLVYGGSE